MSTLNIKLHSLKLSLSLIVLVFWKLGLSYNTINKLTFRTQWIKAVWGSKLTPEYSFSVWYCSLSAFLSSKSMITCRNSILMHFKLFEWALLVYIRSNTLHQNYICEANQTRAPELFQTHFYTKNESPLVSWL